MQTTCCMLYHVFHIVHNTSFFQTFFFQFNTSLFLACKCGVITRSEYSMHDILTCQLTLQLPLIKQQTPAKLHIRMYGDSFESRRQHKTAQTYSRYLVHVGGSDMAMKKQLVRIVNIMNKLNNVERELRKESDTAICTFTVKYALPDQLTMYPNKTALIYYNPGKCVHQGKQSLFVPTAL